VGPGLGEGLDEGTADAARAAGDENRGAVKVDLHGAKCCVL